MNRVTCCGMQKLRCSSLLVWRSRWRKLILLHSSRWWTPSYTVTPSLSLSFFLISPLAFFFLPNFSSFLLHSILLTFFSLLLLFSPFSSLPLPYSTILPIFCHRRRLLLHSYPSLLINFLLFFLFSLSFSLPLNVFLSSFPFFPSVLQPYPFFSPMFYFCSSPMTLSLHSLSSLSLPSLPFFRPVLSSSTDVWCNWMSPRTCCDWDVRVLKMSILSPQGKFFYITPGICPSLSTMRAIVESAGGKLLSRQPSFRKIMEHKQNKVLPPFPLIPFNTVSERVLVWK